MEDKVEKFMRDIDDVGYHDKLTPEQWKELLELLQFEIGSRLDAVTEELKEAEGG